MDDRARDGESGEGPLAIICGGGTVPFAVADAAVRRGRRVVLFAMSGLADPKAVVRYPHHWFRLAQTGRFRRLARAEGCRDVVLIGSAVRPPLGQLRLDWLTLRLLPRIVQLYRGGDDHLLSGLEGLFEDQGFRLIGAHELAPEILACEGPLGRCRPSARDDADIARGLALINDIGSFDVGQAVVVGDNRVLAIEAAEGTDGMLERVAALRTEGRLGVPNKVGVLIKAPKPHQSRRFDLPSIGPQTVDGAARAGLAGIAVVAGEAIVAEPDRVAQAADRAELFVVGVPGSPAGESP